MQKRQGAVKFKGGPMTVIGPELKKGDKAPDFKCADSAASTVSLKDTPAKARIFSVVPSLDTPVCSVQTRKFDKEVSALGDKVACYTVSLDMPFATTRPTPSRR
jgi:thiol peroxidase